MADSVLITGGSGLLALNWALTRRASDAVTLGSHSRRVALDGVVVRPLPLDSVDDILAVLDTVGPGLVVHTAGLTNIETCEADPALAQHVNVDLASNVATACARRGVRLVHISTDHLWRGTDACLGEGAPTAPRNVYGRTKAEAERRVADAHPSALIVRTNFYCWGPSYRQSFVERLVHALRQGQPMTLFSDVWYTPILAEALIGAVHELVQLGVSGIVHVVGDQRVSKHEFGLAVARQFGLETALIREGRLVEMAELVARPSDMSLSNDRASRLLGRSLGAVAAHVSRLYQQEQLGLHRELQRI